MKNYRLVLFVSFMIYSGLIISSCTTNKIEEPLIPQTNIEKEPIIEQAPIITNEPELTIEPELELVSKEELPDDYVRSTNNLENEISIDTFQEDKKTILEIIQKLDKIMRQNDYNSWIKYLTNESIVYWSNTYNLKQVSKKLPVSGFTLNSLEDYFKYIFIPARIGREVTEIRYISETYVKAVQVQKNKDIIYYSFNKKDGKWLIKLEK